MHQSDRDYRLHKGRDSDAVLGAFRLRIEPTHPSSLRKSLECVAQSVSQHKTVNVDVKLDPQEPLLLRYSALHRPEYAKKLYDSSRFFFQNESLLRTHW